MVAPPLASPASASTTVNSEALRLYLQGRLQLNRGDLNAAAASLQAAGRFDPDTPWIPIAQGDVALAGKNMAGARVLWERAIRLDPNCGPAWQRLGRVDREMGDLAAAVDADVHAVDAGQAWMVRADLVELLGLLDRPELARSAVDAWVVQDDAPGREELRARAEARWSVKDYEGAWLDLDAYLEQRPEDIPALDLYLFLTRQLQHFGRALTRLDRAHRALPADLELAKREVAFLEQIGHAPRLLEALSDLHALQSQRGELDPGLELDQARAQLSLGRAADALASLEGVEDIAPNWPRLALLRAQVLLALGRETEARRVLLAGPFSAGELPARARLLREAGDPKAAWKLLEPALNNPSASAALVRAAMRHAAAVGDDATGRGLAARLGSDAQAVWIGALVRTGRRVEAQALLSERITTNPAAKDLRELGALCVSTDPAKAVELLERAVAAQASDRRGRMLLASALLELGEVAQAQAQARAVLSENPRDAMALNLLAWSLAESGGDLVQAEALARQAVDLVPADAHLVDTLGWLLARSGQTGLALPLLQQAAELAPQLTEIQGHIDAVRAGVLPAPTWPSPR